MLLAGMSSILVGLAWLFGVVAYWSAFDFHPIGNVLPAVIGTTLLVLGGQNVLGGFLLAILNGNEARFLSAAERRSGRPESRSPGFGAAHARSA
jgi:hypothetical protein